MAVVVKNVLGSEANDVMKSTGAVEMLDGGAGLDKLTFDEGTRGVSLNLKTGKMTDSFGQRETVAGFEIVIGTSFNDTITGSDNTDYLVGGAGNDKLYGGVGSDELYGGTGNDLLSGGASSDYLVGGQGNDTIQGGDGFDLVDYSDEGGANGVTVNLSTKTATDTYGDTDTFSGVERVRGTELADTLTGNGSVNMFEGGAGNDVIDGAGGNDILRGGFGDDKVLGGSGNDEIVGGRGDDTLDGGTGAQDVVDYSLDEGWHGASVNLTTGSAEDTWGSMDNLARIENVVGSQFADWIFGSKGANVLTGGAGDDTMAGGGGNDTFVFAAGHGNDTINDFNAGDKLDLKAFGWTSVEDVLSRAAGHDLGMVINTGDGTSIVLVDVNISSAATLGYIFA